MALNNPLAMHSAQPTDATSTRRRRICILTERMRLGFGVDLVVDEQSKRLVALGFDVTVVVIHADLVQPPRDYRLVVINRIMAPGDLTSEAGMRQVLFSCDVGEVDLWLLHTPPFYDWAEYLDGPVVLIEYGAPPGRFFGAALGRQIDTMATRRLTRLYSGLLPFDAIVSISNSIHGWLPEAAQRASTVSHLGCDHYPFVPADDAKAFRTELEVSPDECLVLWIGRMQVENDEQPYKGFHELLALMPYVQRHVASARFVLAGRVTDADRARLAGLGITVLANLSAAEMALVYAAADVLINLSQWEGFNLALLEAQFQGTPVVAYDLGPHPEIVLHEKTGLLAKTPLQFFKSVVRIAQDPELRERLSQQARLFALHFTWDRNTADLVRIMTRCLDRAPSGPEIAELREEVAARAQSRTVVGTAKDAGGTAVQSRPASNGSNWLRRVSRDLDMKFSDSLAQSNMQDEVFVEHAYWSLLNRGPTAAEIDGWTQGLRAGDSRQNVLAIMRRSDEGRQRNVTDPHIRQALAKAAGESRRRVKQPATWGGTALRLLQSGGSLPFSPWFSLEDGEFVRHAYRVLLGREAEQDAVEGRVNRLREGHSRHAILAELRFSAEGMTRSLTDPDLRQILFTESIRRSPILAMILKTPTSLEGGPENRKRQLRRVDSQQRALAATVGRVESILGQIPQNAAALDGMTSRIAALEAKLDALTPARDRLPSWSPLLPSFSVNMNACRIGSSHVALVAPGTVIHPKALSRLTAAAKANNSDILFGNEIERVGPNSTESLQVKGPFSYDAFLQNPDLGGVIAVRTELLSQLGQPVTMALTGPAVLQLVALAHTVTFLPVVLCERTTSEIRAARPSLTDMRAYVSRIGPKVSVTDDVRTGFDVRFPVEADWKVGILVVSTGGNGESTLDAIAAKTESGRYCLNLLQLSETPADADGIRPDITQTNTGASPPVLQEKPRRWRILSRKAQSSQPASVPSQDTGRSRRPGRLMFPHGTPYGSVINQAVEQLPADCNLIMIMEQGVLPTSADWLERLVESAMRPGVGIVAPKTLYADGAVRHAGMALGLGDPCGYIARLTRPTDIPTDGRGLMVKRLDALSEVSFVSRHCMLFHRSLFEGQGGLAVNFGRETNDIEFCCRVRQDGLSILLDGRVTMVQADALPRWARMIHEKELRALKSLHSEMSKQDDPYWAPPQDDHDAVVTRTTRIQPLWT